VDWSRHQRDAAALRSDRRVSFLGPKDSVENVIEPLFSSAHAPRAQVLAQCVHRDPRGLITRRLRYTFRNGGTGHRLRGVGRPVPTFWWAPRSLWALDLCRGRIAPVLSVYIPALGTHSSGRGRAERLTTNRYASDTFRDMKRPALVPELYVSDLAQSLKFYISLLGFRIEYERVDEQFAALSLGAAHLMLEQAPSLARASAGRLPKGRWAPSSKP
jgi:hypothetical protein